MVLHEMDKTGSTTQLTPNNTHRQFFQWAVKWFYANVAEDTSKRPDIPSIICMLQAIGFKLEEFEKNDQIISTKNLVKNGSIRVTMECGTSKMIATLEMDDVLCECPNANEETNGSFWSITGTGPSASTDNINRVEKTGSNLLPEMTKETTAVVRDVAYRLFKVINNKYDINQNIELDMNPLPFGPNTTITKSKDIKKDGPVRSYTDYFDKNYKPLTTSNMTTNLSKSNLNTSKSSKDSLTSIAGSKLKRQGTYDLDDNDSLGEPRASPPKTSSSPVLHELCTSLGQISLPSDDEILSLGDYVVKAHQILDKAVNVIIKKLPPGSSNSSLQDDNFAKPIAPPLMSSSFCVSSPYGKSGQNSAANNTINRSINSGSSRTSSTSSLNSARPPPVPASSRVVTKVQRPPVAVANQRSSVGLTTSQLPPMRERSNSCNVPRRTQQVSPSKNLSAANALRRRSGTTAIASSTVAAQRAASLHSSKVPASRLSQPRTSSGTLADRIATNAAAKRRLSPEIKSQTSSPLGQVSRANVSLLKAPSRLSTSMSGNNSLKFGYSAARK